MNYIVKKIYRKINIIYLSFFASNQRTRNELNHEYAIRKIKKLFRGYDFPNNPYINAQCPKIIWLYWNNGIENAPELVKRCVESIRNTFKDYEINILDDKNMSEYIDLPLYLIKKHEQGIIPHAHFSDLLRISLLAKHGGIWLDSTVFCVSQKIPKYMVSEKLFVFKAFDLDRSDETFMCSSNWFISSCPENNIVVATREILYKYWKKYNRVIDYFIFHLIFKLVCTRYKEEFDSIIMYPNISPHLLMFNLENNYDDQMWELIKQQCPIQKLNKAIVSENPNSFYQKLINRELN